MWWLIGGGVVLYLVIGLFVGFAYGMSDNGSDNEKSSWAILLWPVYMLRGD